MKDLFPEYYRPTEAEFKQIWETCLFSFDANVLLDVYRYTPDTRNRLLHVLEQLQDRIWLTHQAAEEFLRNRIGVILSLEVPYSQAREQVAFGIRDIKTDLAETFPPSKRQHPFIRVEEIHHILDGALTSLDELLNQTRGQQPSFLKQDDLLQQLTSLFNGRTGSPYTQEELDECYVVIANRYSFSIPPGFKDREGQNKKREPQKGDPNPQAYGDAVLWMQLLDRMKNEERPLIFVTGETKEDWWLKEKGQTIGPLPALIREMRKEADTLFHMYSTDIFLQRAEEFLGLQVLPSAVDEIRDLRRLDEATAAQALRTAQMVFELTQQQFELQQKLQESAAALASTEDRLRALETYTRDIQHTITPDQGAQISQLVKAIALELGKRSGRNEYGGVYGELYNRFGISNYRQLPALRFKEAVDFLTDWYSRIRGEGPDLPVSVS